MTREEAIAAPGLWSGFVRTAPGMVSGWHHHADHDTSIFVVSGAFRLESGPGGRDVHEAAPGDFLHIPPRAIHRESNPGDAESTVVVTRAGTGQVTVNVEGPEP